METASTLEQIFPGSSDMSRRMRSHDWSATPLGDPQGWPESLKIPLRMLLTSRFEMWLGWGPDLCFFYNDAYAPTLGLRHPTMLAKPFKAVWPEVYDDVADQVALVRAGESTWNDALLLLLQRSGYAEETYHSFSYSPLYGSAGAVEGLLCIVSEETERVISERRLEMLRALGASLVGVVDRDGVRGAICSVFGASRHDFPFALTYLAGDDGWEGSACSADAASLVAHDWAFGDGTAPTPIAKIAMPEGVERPAGPWDRPPEEAVIVPIAGPTDENVDGFLVLGLNPYRQREAELGDFATLVAGQISGALARVAALDSERRRADRIWTQSRDLMVVAGADGILRSVSPAWTRILGHRLEDVVGHSFAEFVVPDDLTETEAGLARTIEATELTGFENRYVALDGSTRWISWNTTMEGGLAYAYGRDITEQKEREDALAAAEEALRQAQKMEAVGQLTGGIAHDFNNLLTGIIGSLDIMQRRTAQGRTADVERYATIAMTSANRAAALTQRLLAFARRQPLAPKSVDANQLLQGMDDLIRRSIGEAIAFEIVAGGGLWRTQCDPNQLESAVLNLVINARDAMPDGGRLTIETANSWIDAAYAERYRFAKPGQYVTVSVTDTGHGMSPDVISKAFDPFFTTKPIGQGTGLGLSMIYGFARQSDGFVNIYSEVEEGTTVRLYLPRFMGKEVEEAAIADSPHIAVPASGVRTTILVVEDEPAILALVTDLLEELGYAVLQASDGPSGLEILLSDRKIDLLLTDVGLPGLNGRQLADAARARRPDLKILFSTGYAHNAAVGNGLLEPGMEIITKPFAVNQLARRIAAMVG